MIKHSRLSYIQLFVVTPYQFCFGSIKFCGHLRLSLIHTDLYITLCVTIRQVEL